MRSVEEGLSHILVGSMAWHMVAIIVKATIIVAVGGGAGMLARGSSATERYRIWAAVFVSLFAALALHGAAAYLDIGLVTVSSPTPLAQRATTSRTPRGGAGDAVIPLPDAQPIASVDPTDERSIPTLPLIWVVGACVSAVPIAVSLTYRRQLRRTAYAATAQQVSLASGVAAEFGLARRVQLVTSPSLSVPLTWGGRRPVVMLPATSDAWSEDTLIIVLRHEFAHIDRLDAPMLLFARSITALLWFHPLVWLSLRSLRMEQELAADELVLDRLPDRIAYADTILAIARDAASHHELSRQVMAPTLSSANTLERRLRAILFARCRPRRSSHRYRIPLGIAATSGVLILTAIGPATERVSAEHRDTPLVVIAKATPVIAADTALRFHWRDDAVDIEVTLRGRTRAWSSLADLQVDRNASVAIARRAPGTAVRRYRSERDDAGALRFATVDSHSTLTRDARRWLERVLRRMDAELVLWTELRAGRRRGGQPLRTALEERQRDSLSRARTRIGDAWNNWPDAMRMERQLLALSREGGQ